MEQSANLFFFTWLGSNFWLVIQLKGEFPVEQSSRPMIQIFLFCQCRKECTCTDQLLSERLGFFFILSNIQRADISIPPQQSWYQVVPTTFSRSVLSLAISAEKRQQ